MILEHTSLTYKGKRIFERLVMGQFGRMPKHFEAGEACFMFVEMGSFHMRTPDCLIPFTSGDGMLAKCNNYYIEKTATDLQFETQTTKVLGAYFYPDIIKNLFNTDLSLSDFQSNYDLKKVNIDALMQHFLSSIYFLLDNPSVASDDMILTKLKELLLILSKSDTAPSIIDFVSSLFKPLEYDFKTVIEKNIFSDLSLEEYAHLCSMSVSTFKRHFKDIFQDSPAHYIKLKRLEKAAELLKITTDRITDICYDCGFSDIGHFSKSFIAQYGCAPSEYRLQS